MRTHYSEHKVSLGAGERWFRQMGLKPKDRGERKPHPGDVVERSSGEADRADINHSRSSAHSRVTGD